MDAVRWDRVTFTTHMVEAAAVVAECQVAFDFEGHEQVCYEVKVFRALKGASAQPFFAVATNRGDPAAFRPLGEGDSRRGGARGLSRRGRHPPPPACASRPATEPGTGSRDAPRPGGHRRARPLKRMTFTMNGFEGLALANKDYVAEQYRRWKADPRSVDESWQLFFAGFELAADGRNGAARSRRERRRAARGGRPSAGPQAASGARGVRSRPLLPRARPPGRAPEPARARSPESHPLLEPSEFGFGDADLDRIVDSGSFQGVGAGRCAS